MKSNATKKQDPNPLDAGDGISTKRSTWSFGGDVSRSFDAHVRSSVPLYDLGHEVICELSDFFVHDSSVCYELGTSLGTLLCRLAEHHQHKSEVKWVGVDAEQSMITEAQRLLPGLPPNYSKQLNFVVDDINTMELQKSDLIVAYYTIQFIPPHLRQELINKIYEALNWGGAFIVFEKVRACDARFQDYMTQLYTEYKVAQGYSAEEILNKASSLKSVLEPFSTQGNLEMFKRAGFVDVMTVQKWVSFEGFLCVK